MGVFKDARILRNSGLHRSSGTVYDNLLTGDYAKMGVLATIMELLFLVEDIGEHAQGNSICGKVFIERLITLVSSRVRSLRLERVAAGTLCALITKSPENQELFVGNDGACANLFRTTLTTCDDFYLQATISEVLYKLSKSHTVVLRYVDDDAARQAITEESLKSVSSSGKAYVHSHLDASRRPVLVVIASKHSSSDDEEGSKKLCVYLIERAIEELPPSFKDTSSPYWVLSGEVTIHGMSRAENSYGSNQQLAFLPS